MSIDAALIVRVPATPGRFYEFRKLTSGAGVDIHTGSNGRENSDFYFGMHSSDKGCKAICYAVERLHQLEQFFEAARKLSVTRAHDDVFDGFIDEDLCDDESYQGQISTEAAWELVGTMIEEANAAEEKDRLEPR